jgi:uncharacterized protein
VNTNPLESKRSLLIIFYRNPQLGKVKTRLAATVGNAKALSIYLRLAEHTKAITLDLPVERVVYYSDFVDQEDHWISSHYQKQVQSGTDLGERMAIAFREGFKSGYTSVCIIGTDCLELTAAILREGFNKLKTHDVVIGPARDGGYYLLGMKTFYPDFFEKKSWSSDSVCAATVQDFDALRLKYYQLPLLADVDEEKDLPNDLLID